MKIRQRRSICAWLAVLLIFVTVLSCASCGGGGSKGEDTTVGTGEPSDTDAPVQSPSKTLYEIDTEGKTMIRAAFTGKKDTTPLETSLVSESGDLQAAVSATWTAETVTVFVSYAEADAISVTLGSATKSLHTDASGRSSTSFSYAEIGAELTDLEQKLPLQVLVTKGEKKASFDGFVMLCDYETFTYCDLSGSSVFQSSKLSLYRSTSVVKNADAGSKAENGGLRIWDRYSESGKNYAKLRNRVSTAPISKIEATSKNLLAEFDIRIDSMPVYEWNSLTQDASYGLSFVLSEEEGGTSVLVGFLNTASGIGIFLNGKDTDAGTDSSDILYTGKRLGETLHMGFVWSSGEMDVYLDGALLGHFSDVNVARSAGYGDHTASFVWQRNDSAAKSAADSFEARIDHFGLAYLTDYSLVQTITPTTILGKDYRTVAGEDIYLASSALSLPTELNNSKYGLSSRVIWQSSDPSVVTEQGELIQPKEAGEFVSLTAFLADGDKIVSKKSFSLFVKASDPSERVLWKKNDADPFSGTATAADTSYIVDDTNNSIVYDMGSVTEINRAVLVSRNTKNRVTGNFVALYVSDDNQTYTAIPEFCMLHADSELYFYDFSVTGRYLKIHFTYSQSPEYSVAIFNSLQRAMRAYYSTEPLLSGDGSFAKSVSVTVENPKSATVYNKIVTYTLEQLGIAASDLRSDLSDIRFRCGDAELPHYYANGVFYVRILEIAANSSVQVKVLYGNVSAGSVSDGNATLEIEYGTKTITERPGGVAWRNSVAVMPDGSLLSVGPYDGNGYLGMERSTDGGHSWTATKKITVIGSANGQEQGGGFIVDYDRNIVYFLAYKNNGSGDMYILKSTDSGENWTVQQSFSGIGVFTYSDGIKVSCYDGSGPNVDYVFSVVVSSYITDGSEWSGFASSLYSKDGGETWVLSDTRIRYGSLPENTYWASHESGVSEETVWEKKDGTLILYARYQGYDDVNRTLDVPHFVVAYSYDHGVTWKDIKLSTVYTTNTQPILAEYDGISLLLWGGNNSAAFRSYDRFPLNVAYSVDDAENFIGIMDISYQTELMHRIEYRPDSEKYIVTNPDIAVFEKGGVDCAYILITNYRILIENFSNYLYKTKGAFDSFETGDAASEGWATVSGTTVDPGPDTKVPGELPTIGKTGATDGEYAMQLGSYTEVSRSVPYTQKGEFFFDWYIERLGGGTTFELQAAYNRKANITSPVVLYISSAGDVCYYDSSNILVKTGLKIGAGAHRFSIVFDAEAGTARLTLDGQTVDIAWRTGCGDAVCFFHIRNGNDASVALDRFGLISAD